jgi:HAD domain in Swiss Army Knife RNA repair proteins
MKVIFLDIDGVLNCDHTPNPRKFPYVVDKKLLARFKKLLSRTGAKVVLSSSWRLDPVGLLAAKHWGVPFIDVAPDTNRTMRGRVLRKRSQPKTKMEGEAHWTKRARRQGGSWSRTGAHRQSCSRACARKRPLNCRCVNSYPSFLIRLGRTAPMSLSNTSSCAASTMTLARASIGNLCALYLG